MCIGNNNPVMVASHDQHLPRIHRIPWGGKASANTLRPGAWSFTNTLRPDAWSFTNTLRPSSWSFANTLRLKHTQTQTHSVANTLRPGAWSFAKHTQTVALVISLHVHADDPYKSIGWASKHNSAQTERLCLIVNHTVHWMLLYTAWTLLLFWSISSLSKVL